MASDYPEEKIDANKEAVAELTQTVTKTVEGEVKIYTNPKIPILKAADPVSQFSDRRAHPRLNLELEVLVICGGVIHKSTSQNISLGGLLLSSPIPEKFIGKALEIIITDPTPYAVKSKILSLKGRATESRLCSALKFEKLDVATANRLQHIMAHLTARNKQNSRAA